MIKILKKKGFIVAYDLDEDWADKMLQIVESAGMLPPIEPYRRIEDLDLGAPEWEDENE